MLIIVISISLSILEKCDILHVVYRNFGVKFLLLCQTIVVLFIKLDLEANAIICYNLW